MSFSWSGRYVCFYCLLVCVTVSHHAKLHHSSPVILNLSMPDDIHKRVLLELSIFKTKLFICLDQIIVEELLLVHLFGFGVPSFAMPLPLFTLGGRIEVAEVVTGAAGTVSVLVIAGVVEVAGRIVAGMVEDGRIGITGRIEVACRTEVAEVAIEVA